MRLFVNAIRAINIATEVCNITKCSKLYIPYFFIDCIVSRFVYGASPESYMNLEFYNKKRWSKNKFLTDGRHRHIDGYFNEKSGIETLLNKNKFLLEYKEFIKRDYILVNKDTSKELLNVFISKHEKCIIKPLTSCCGQGVSKINSSEIINYMNGGNLLAEEVIENCSYLKALNPSSLNTIRIVTCKDKNNNIHIMAIVLRVGVAGQSIDNYCGGGVAYHVNIEEGIVDCPGQDVKGKVYIRHPSTNTMMIGFKIPRFKELIDYIMVVANHKNNVRYVGWDVAMTENGFELIEGNNCPDPNIMQVFTHKGLFDEVLSYI